MKHGIYDATHEPRQVRRFNYVSLLIGLGAVVLMGRGILSFIPERQPVKIISPVPEVTPTPTVIPTKTITPKPTAVQRPTKGKASYYSIEGCLGCSPTLTMANGQRLDDTKLTLAYNHAPLNTQVKIRNTKTGATVVATITDRGGFERHGKIADLTIATRDALGCGDICPIELVW